MYTLTLGVNEDGKYSTVQALLDHSTCNTGVVPIKEHKITTCYIKEESELATLLNALLAVLEPETASLITSGDRLHAAPPALRKPRLRKVKRRRPQWAWSKLPRWRPSTMARRDAPPLSRDERTTLVPRWEGVWDAMRIACVTKACVTQEKTERIPPIDPIKEIKAAPYPARAAWDKVELRIKRQKEPCSAYRKMQLYSCMQEGAEFGAVCTRVHATDLGEAKQIVAYLGPALEWKVWDSGFGEYVPCTDDSATADGKEVK